MDIADLISHLVIYMVVLLLAISAHEAGHAWVSYKNGDDTAFMLGRVTLNPIAHTDPIGTLLIPMVSFLFGAIGGGLASIPLIGWGKPTPVNPRKWTNYKIGNVTVSIAGVIANLILLTIGFIAAKVMISQGFDIGDFFGQSNNPFAILVGYVMTLNLSLFVFNLLPFPPLDGSKILQTFLPESAEPIFNLLEQYGFLILMALIYIGVLRLVITPFFYGLIYLLRS
ncbi:MAG: site-2 protease family protein [Acidobacteria bacterium]|nr:MAG: site-2 protease family protein [Acidobacteriota bacterium]